MTLSTRITTSFATVAILGSLFAQSAFADDLTISGNGKKSENKIEVTTNCTSEVIQSNQTQITNDVTSKANSGGNKANDNGGDVTINAGGATSSVTITNSGSSNEASVTPCCCGDQLLGTSVDISGNLKKSKNTVKKTSTTTSSTLQANATALLNTVKSKAKSGKNKANDNLGTVEVTTDDAESTVDVTNTLPSNTLNP